MRRQTRRAMETAGSAEIVARFPQPLGKRCAFPTVPTAPTTTSPNQVSAEPGQDQSKLRRLPANVREPLAELRRPVSNVGEPTSKLRGPAANVGGPMSKL